MLKNCLCVRFSVLFMCLFPLLVCVSPYCFVVFFFVRVVISVVENLGREILICLWCVRYTSWLRLFLSFFFSFSPHGAIFLAFLRVCSHVHTVPVPYTHIPATLPACDLTSVISAVCVCVRVCVVLSCCATQNPKKLSKRVDFECQASARQQQQSVFSEWKMRCFPFSLFLSVYVFLG